MDDANGTQSFQEKVEELYLKNFMRKDEKSRPVKRWERKILTKLKDEPEIVTMRELIESLAKKGYEFSLDIHLRRGILPLRVGQNYSKGPWIAEIFDSAPPILKSTFNGRAFESTHYFTVCILTQYLGNLANFNSEALAVSSDSSHTYWSIRCQKCQSYMDFDTTVNVCGMCDHKHTIRFPYLSVNEDTLDIMSGAIPVGRLVEFDEMNYPYTSKRDSTVINAESSGNNAGNVVTRVRSFKDILSKIVHRTPS